MYRFPPLSLWGLAKVLYQVKKVDGVKDKKKKIAGEMKEAENRIPFL